LRSLKDSISAIEKKESELTSEINLLAAAIPSLTRDETPRDTYRQTYTSPHPKVEHSCSHVDIGLKLKLLNFTAAATTSGWGWYFLTGDAVLLAQALVLYAQSIARKHKWRLAEPPSIVRTDIAYATGFQPRDPNSKSQIFKIQQHPEDVGIKPELCLAGTAEIPLAGMNADTTLEEKDLPLKYVAASRCYRQEAGARGMDTKGLYRLKEFTKLEMFAWTLPSETAAIAAYNEMITIQKHILDSLSLHYRVLEMPSTDLGASAWCKTDIEAWFPSRRSIDDGYGEVTSTSICTDYQTRRLATRVNLRSQGISGFPYTVNGTAIAVPRVLAAILENGWNEKTGEVDVPEVLWPYMDGLKTLSASR
jgi:seryl-tRNA synthetase